MPAPRRVARRDPCHRSPYPDHGTSKALEKKKKGGQGLL
jgi:hypothetical protein